MDGILSQSSAHPLGERHHVGVVPLAEAQAAEVLVLRVPGVALQARRDLTHVDAEGRERFESASAAAALTRPFITSPAPLARFFRARGGCRALADEALHLKLRVLGHLFANADLLGFHGCKVLHHLSKRERGRLEHG